MINLKTILCFITSIIFFINVSYAQEINYGLSLGLSKTSGIYDQDRYNILSNSEINYNIMALVYLPSNSNFRAQTGLKYFKAGYNLDLNGRSFVGPNPIKYDINLSFIAIPFNLNYTLPFMSNVYLIGGFEAAYLISAFSDILYDDKSSLYLDIYDRLNNFNVFLNLGFGLSVPFQSLTLFIQPEYTRSVKSLSESSTNGSASNLESLTLNVGFRF